MSANPQKTEYRRVYKITNIARFKMNGKKIMRAHNVKSHGSVIDQELMWNDHFNLLKGKVAAGLSSLKQLKNILPQSKLCSVYRALVESYIRYADVVWDNSSKTKLHTLQHFQDRALSIIKEVKTNGQETG